jgi:hypothetical protein
LISFIVIFQTGVAETLTVAAIAIAWEATLAGLAFASEASAGELGLVKSAVRLAAKALSIVTVTGVGML